MKQPQTPDIYHDLGHRPRIHDKRKRTQKQKAPDDLYAWMNLQEDINREVAGEISYLRKEIKKLKEAR